MCGCLLHTPNWGPDPKPRHVPWLGIEPVTFQFAGWRSIHWATPATAKTQICIMCPWGLGTNCQVRQDWLSRHSEVSLTGVNDWLHSLSVFSVLISVTACISIISFYKMSNNIPLHAIPHLVIQSSVGGHLVPIPSPSCWLLCLVLLRHVWVFVWLCFHFSCIDA